MVATFVYLFLGMVVANFLWQAATQRDWGRAAERSFFQGAALVIAFLALNL